jgi:monoamine oxidase
MDVSRRSFLRTVAMTGLGATIGGSAGPVLGRPRDGARKKRVLIVGGGLSGLVCGYELVAAGHDVVILEARRRAGGRVRTDRSFADGMHAELGAARIPMDHDLTLGYAGKFGLDVTPFFPSDGSIVHYLRGTRVRAAPDGAADIGDYPIESTERERELGFGGIFRQSVRSVIDELGDPRDPDWPLGPVREYDAMTWAEFQRRRGISEEVTTAMGVGWMPKGGSPRSAAWVLREIALAAQTTEMVKIVGGNDRLPTAFADRLAGHIQYGAAVRRIEQTGDGCTVHFERSGRREALTGDRLVCTLPFPIVRQIDIVPGVSRLKQRAIDRMNYGHLSRASIQVSRRYWRDDGFNGFGRTDQVAELFNPTWDQAGERGIIQLYMKWHLSEHAEALDADDRVQLAADAINEVFPGLHAHAEGGTCQCWADDPHARGAVAALNPGQLVGLLPHAGTPEGRIHFAGEHTSQWHGWMQGALASGLRAAGEVNEA